MVDDGLALLLDVREDAEWREVHVPAAVHVPLSTLTPQDFAGRTVLAMCRSGRRSAKAVEALEAAGVLARNVTGGIQAWMHEGLPVVHGDDAPGSIR